MDNQQFVKEKKKSTIFQKMQPHISFQIIITIIKKYLIFFTNNQEKDIQRN